MYSLFLSRTTYYFTFLLLNSFSSKIKIETLLIIFHTFAIIFIGEFCFLTEVVFSSRAWRDCRLAQTKQNENTNEFIQRIELTAEIFAYYFHVFSFNCVQQRSLRIYETEQNLNWFFFSVKLAILKLAFL